MSEIIVEMKDYLKIKGGKYIRDLVRCKDCKRFDTGYCVLPFIGGKVNPNHYCGYGEREEE